VQSCFAQANGLIEHYERLRQQVLSRNLGWSADQITIIDCDQGQSGSSIAGRKGFQKLVTEVSMNRASIVMGLEVSRLARN
jgi:DNA invertase Pin-like site-specific DNA recombinase